MHTVAVVALPDVIAFDLSTAVEVFGHVVLPFSELAYRMLMRGTEPVVNAGPPRIATPMASMRLPARTPSSFRAATTSPWTPPMTCSTRSD